MYYLYVLVVCTLGMYYLYVLVECTSCMYYCLIVFTSCMYEMFERVLGSSTSYTRY